MVLSGDDSVRRGDQRAWRGGGHFPGGVTVLPSASAVSAWRRWRLPVRLGTEAWPEVPRRACGRGRIPETRRRAGRLCRPRADQPLRPGPAAAHGGQGRRQALHAILSGRLGGGFGPKRLGSSGCATWPGRSCSTSRRTPPRPSFAAVTVAQRAGNLPSPAAVHRGSASRADRGHAGQARVVMLTGPAWSGRPGWRCRWRPRWRGGSETALAARAAPVRDPAGVDDAVAVAFSVIRPAGTAPARRCGSLARQQLLLVLENCEHLIEGRRRWPGRWRGRRAPAILVTSREAWRSTGSGGPGAAAGGARRRR